MLLCSATKVNLGALSRAPHFRNARFFNEMCWSEKKEREIKTADKNYRVDFFFAKTFHGIMKKKRKDCGAGLETNKISLKFASLKVIWRQALEGLCRSNFEEKISSGVRGA